METGVESGAEKDAAAAAPSLGMRVSRNILAAIGILWTPLLPFTPRQRKAAGASELYWEV